MYGFFFPATRSDTEKIQSGIGDKVAVFLQYFTTFVAGYVIAFTSSWKLSLVLATMVPLLVLMAAMIAKVSSWRMKCRLAAWIYMLLACTSICTHVL